MPQLRVLHMRDRYRIYPRLPPQERLRKWLQRVHTTSRQFKRPRVFLLPDRLAEVLGLPKPHVELDAQGHLWSDSQIIASVS